MVISPALIKMASEGGTNSGSQIKGQEVLSTNSIMQDLPERVKRKHIEPEMHECLMTECGRQ
jgi:hypothetical protein